MIGSRSASSARSFESAWTKDGERKRSSEGTGGDGAAVAPVPSGRSAPASATNRLAPGGGMTPPRGRACVLGISSPPLDLCAGTRRPPRAGLSPFGRRGADGCEHRRVVQPAQGECV